MKNSLTIGILSWKNRKTLQNTLDSYERAGLLSYPQQIFIFFNEIDEEDKKMADKYGIKYYGSETNLGIAGAYKEMLNYVEQPHFLFLENDWYIRHEEIPLLIPQLDDGQKFLWLADVIRLRSRRTPGDPLWTIQFKDKELERPEHLLDCVHWTEDPDLKFPKEITKIAPKWYCASAKNANWTNNPHMVRTDWAKKVLVPHLEGDIELSLQSWWQTTDYKVVQGEGFFEHNPTFPIRGIEMALFGKDSLSNHIRREKDFFEANILDYIKDNHPVQKTIIDAGASLGNHTVYFANFLKYDSIHCFEPIPDIFKLLEINANYPNVHLYNKALSHINETLHMYFNRINTGASKVKSGGAVEVEAITIDSLNLQDVTFIKIDVEDSEEYVVKGARETINRCHPLVMVEDYRNRPWGELLPGYVLERGWPNQNTFLYKWVEPTEKPYLIQLYTRTPGCINYERTFPLVADSVRPLPIVLRSYRGHLHRWDHMPMTLGDNMCIFTDSADVIFQKPFPQLDSTKIYVSNEGVNFQDSGIWRGLIRRYPQFEPMLPEIIYNVGTFACNGNLMKSWCDYLFSVRGKCRRHSLEQLWFNEWLRLPEIKPLITEHPDLFAVMYANIKVGKAFIKDGKVVNKDGVLFSACHFNGGTKDDYHKILYNETD